ncbi:hypothetical protein J6590_040750 [Homalodisca vitripennis]|nr:hypothetical protein J6590_040750 [Homalodisca vitripennis]
MLVRLAFEFPYILCHLASPGMDSLRDKTDLRFTVGLLPVLHDCPYNTGRTKPSYPWYIKLLKQVGCTSTPTTPRPPLVPSYQDAHPITRLHTKMFDCHIRTMYVLIFPI